MPPRRFSKPHSKQASIKDMLQAKRPNREANKVINQIPDFLRSYINVVKPENRVADYAVSPIALQYFRKHSNINDLQADYMVGRSSMPDEMIFSQMVRCAVSTPVKGTYKPFNRFQYESSYHESIARTLLINPGIKDEETLELFLKFQNKYCLKLPLVNMLQNNEAHSDALTYYARKAALQKTEGKISASRNAIGRYVVTKYLERNGLQEIVYLTDITVQTLENISNFKRVIEKQMIKRGTKPDLYEGIATRMLQDSKKDPSMLIGLEFLIFYPKYIFIANILTLEQELKIASSCKNFYKYTTANYWRESQYPEPTKEDFYETYRNRDDVERKMPPFNKLLFCEDSESDESNDDSDDVFLRPATLQYKTRSRFETNMDSPRVETPVILENENSNSFASTSLTTVLRNPSKPGPKSRVPLTRLHQENILPKFTNLEDLESAELPDELGTPTAQSTQPHEVHSTSVHSEQPEKPATSPTLISPRTRSQVQQNENPRPVPKPRKIFVSPRSRAQVIPQNSVVLARLTGENLSQHNIQQELLQQNQPSQSFQEVVQKQAEQLPDFYVDEDIDFDESSLSYNCIKLLLADGKFTSQVKNHLKEKYSKHFDTFWQSTSPVILTRFIIDLWSNDIETLKSYVMKCQEHTKVAALEHIDNYIKSQQEAPEINLTQEQFIIEQSSNTSEEVELVVGTIPVATVSPIQVKAEPLSQAEVHLNYDSDLICVGDYVGSEIVINESMDEEDALIQQLNANHQDQNCYLNQINEGTQSDELADAPPGETTLRFKKYALRSVEQLAGDKREVPNKSVAASTRARRKVPDATVVASSKRRRNAPAPNIGLEYIESQGESQPDIESGNETEALVQEQMLNDDFSVFLSSQLMIDQKPADEVQVPPEPPSFTFIPSSAEHFEQPEENFCFIAQLKRVLYVKELRFDIQVTLPQYNLYDLTFSDDNIKPLLDVTDEEYAALLSLLNVIEKYEYSLDDKRTQIGDNFLVKQLDLFFSSQLKFKSLQFTIENGNFTCGDGCHSLKSNGDLTSAIPSDLLSAITANVD